MFKYEECDRLDDSLYQIAVSELRTARDVVMSQVSSKFDQLEQQLKIILEKRNTKCNDEKTQLQETVGAMMNSVSKAEKHMLTRQPGVFL